MFQKAIHRVRPKDSLNGTFFAFCMKTYDSCGILRSYYTGAGIPHLTGKSLAKVVFPLPPRAEQDRIVAKVNQLMALCNALESQLAASQTAGEKLLGALVRDLVNGAG